MTKEISTTEYYVGYQIYYGDEWCNTYYTKYSELEAEAKLAKGKLKHMYLGDSYNFEHDTFYYIDSMGHTVLFRGITEWNSELITKQSKYVKSIIGTNIVYKETETKQTSPSCYEDSFGYWIGEPCQCIKCGKDVYSGMKKDCPHNFRNRR